MNKPSYSEQLRKYRQSKNLSVKDVSSYLSKNVRNVSEKTIYGWENGVSKPGSDILISLCELYEIPDVLQVFGNSFDNADNNSDAADNSKDSSSESNSDSMYFLTPKEWALIQAYRENPAFTKAVRKLYDLDD